MATETLSVKITADDSSFSSAMNRMFKEVDNVSKKFEGLSRVGDGLKNVGTKLTAGITLPLAGVGVASAKTAMDFESGMQQVSAISGATGKDLDTLSNLAKDMGAKTKFSAVESAEALTYMGMAGWKTQDMVSGLPGILNLAAAGGTDLALTSDIVTDGLTAMGLSASDTDMFVDIMAATCSNANTNIELMGETLSYVGPVAGALGISMGDLSVAIGLMGNAGIKGSQAGTALRAGLTNLVSPSKQASQAMQEYGIEIVKNKDGQVDLMGTMQNLRTNLGGLSETEQAAALSAIFGKEAMSGWAAIVNASESDFTKLTSAISNSDGVAQSMADTMMVGAKGALTEMKSALEGVAITIGERLTPFIEQLADWITNLCTKFQELNPATQTFIMVIAAIAAAIGPLLIIVGNCIKGFAALKVACTVLGVAFGALSAPILIAIAAITALIAAGVWLCQNWDMVKQWASDLGNKINEVFSNIGQWISNCWNNVVTWTTNCWNSIVNFLTPIWDTICNIVQVGIMLIGEIISAGFQIITLPFQFIWQNCSEFLISIWNSMSSFLSKTWNSISSIASSIWNGISSKVSSICKSLSSTVSNIWNSLKSSVSNICKSLSSTVSNIWNSLKSGLSNIVNSIKSSISTGFNTTKQSAINIFNSLKSSVSNIWNSIKSAIEKPINTAKNAVQKAVDAMKRILNITLPFPKIKMPHFSISGKFSLKPPSVPKFNVSWNAKGGIFRKPTIFNTAAGLQGVGEAGSEAIIPLKGFYNHLDDKLDTLQGNGNINITVNANVSNDMDIRKLADDLAYHIRRKNIAIGGI